MGTMFKENLLNLRYAGRSWEDRNRLEKARIDWNMQNRLKWAGLGSNRFKCMGIGWNMAGIEWNRLKYNGIS